MFLYKSDLEIEINPSELLNIAKSFEEGASYFLKNKKELLENTSNKNFENRSKYSLGNGNSLILSWRPKFENGEIINY